MELELIQDICANAGAEPLALATILAVKGSSPRHPGSKMLAGLRGGRAVNLAGTVGGGMGESLALEACGRSIGNRCGERLQVEMVGADVTGPLMVCGGSNLMLVECLEGAGPYLEARERLLRGERVLFVKRVPQAGGPVQVTLCDQQGQVLAGPAEAVRPEPAARALATGQPHFDEEAGLFYDPAFPLEQLLILGGGHVGRALAGLAPALGFAVTVVDDRPEFADGGRYPAEVRTLHADFAAAIAGFPFNAATYAVVVSRGHRSDLACVRALLAREWRYCGFMGSARKVRLILDQVLEEGADPAKVAALWAPVGLDIGAETPPELAVAILAELVAVRRNAEALAGLRHQLEARRA
jgi:xanthine dehydrogenase accessory factor